MVFIIDNYDSFTYNLVQYLGELTEVKVARNDKVGVRELESENPDQIIISPGPGRPVDAGNSNDIIRYFKDKIPILGVCLGHQCIGHVFGARIIRADRIYHGKTSQIYFHGKNSIFNQIENPFTATRYHSLIVDPDSVPETLNIIAETDQGEIMGLVHRDHPVYGVQFHPESILTAPGKKLLKNFINIKGGSHNV